MDFDRQNELNTYNGDALLQGFGNTNICVFMYYPDDKHIEVPQKACDRYHCKPVYEHMPYSFAEDFVHPEDYPAFIELYHKIDQGETTASASFHSKDKRAYCRVTLTALAKAQSQAPKKVLGIIEDISDWDKDKRLIALMQGQIAEADASNGKLKEARLLIASAIGGQFFALYHIWLESRSYVCFQEQLPGILSVIGETGDYEPAWDSYISNYIVPADQPGMTQFANINTLAERLKDKQMISHEYRRKEIGWTRGQFIVAKRDANGYPTNVVYTVIDINAEKTMELAQSKAVFEALHDPLTGVYNRKGFEEIVSSPKNRNIPIGFAIIDIDNFKIVNDTLGHETGDQILKEVAALLKNVFRAHDSVFRIGGDEFAVLLYNCPSSAWDTLCEKQHYIHAVMDQMFKDISVTLSVGIAFSSDGYTEQVFRRSDEQLYEVKRNGRSGCSMVDLQTGETNHWRDISLAFKSQSILEFNNTGLYRIEYPLDKTVSPRLLCGDLTREIFAFPKEATPEECYKQWVSNIDPAYLDVMSEARQMLMQGKQAECTYQWNHPALGKIYIRTGGSGDIKDGIQVLHGYHHLMKDTKIMERKNDSQLMLDSMSAIYFCSYYVDLDHDCFYTMKNAPGEKLLEIQENKATDALTQFLITLVSPEYLKKMTAFMDLSTLRSRLENEVHLDCEYLSRTNMGWCRATFFPVKHDTNGRLTHVLFVVTSLDRQKSKEAEKGAESRKSITALYNNVPGGIIMYEWDGKALKTLHISEYYQKEYGYTLNQNQGSYRGPDFKRVHPDDLAGYQAAIMKALTETHELHYEYRVWNQAQNRYLWTHIDATSEDQPDGTSLVFALYTDVTTQKALAQELEKSRSSMQAALGVSNQLCYEYDPVTHTGTCYTDENYFGLPKVIENYPDSLQDFNLLHPEDAELFLKTAHMMDSSTSKAHCDVRFKKDGQYGWYSCFFNAYFDSQKEYTVAILTVIDISERKAIMNDYNAWLAAVIDMAENSLVLGQCNLTDNTVDFFKASDEFQPLIEGVKTFDERIARNVDYIVGEKSKAAFTSLFNRRHLLEMVAQGQMRAQMEYLFRMPGQHTHWLETGVNMVRNPLTETVTAISYSRSVREERISSLLLENTLHQDYLKAGVVLADTDEFYLLDQQDNGPQNCQSHFWARLKAAMLPLVTPPETLTESELDKETIMAHLKKDGEYSCSFASCYYGANSRLQLHFRYLQKEQNMLLVFVRNITDDALMSQLRHDSEHDLLTNLYNRKTTFRKCRELLDAYPDEQFVMVHADMRHFRLFNTFFGESSGDKLLCDAADLFRWMDHDYDHWVYGRIEGDVFCAFFPYDQKLYQKHIDRAITLLRNYRTDFLIEPVLGVYFVTDRTMPIDAMFTRATLAAKTVQAKTPYATVIYDETLERKLTEEQQVLNDMQAAIDEEQFEVYLQPKYSLRTNKPVGAESLVRWRHPQKGLISPGVFIPVFESNGFITTLDHYMWERVCRLLSQWKKEGKPLAPISVNVSRLSMFGKSTVDFLKSLIKKYDIDPKYLELELTESAYIDDPEEMRLQMLALREAGFKILLDDFGSGYSCLNTLRELPVDILKMDMKFLSLEKEDVRGGLVISSIIRMASLLKLTVIAEGVETQEQADFLKGSGCEYVQGYLYARPMPVAEYEKLIISKDTPPLQENAAAIHHIGRILAETNSGTYAMGTVIPAPLACLEYSEHTFEFMRANPEFFEEFGLSDEHISITGIFKDCLSPKSYKALIQALEDSVQTGEKKQAAIIWNDKDGTRRKYLCRVAYEGAISTSAAIVVVFMRLTDDMLALMDDLTQQQDPKGE